MIFNNNIGLAKKIKYTVAVIGIGISLTYLLVGFEIQGFHTAVNLGTNIFYVGQGNSYLAVPHPQESIANEIRWNFGQDAKLATAIFTAESGLHCDRISKTSDYGLAQINLKAHPQYTASQLLDCKTNIKIAAKIYHQQGNWNAWVSYKNKSYLKYL